MVITKNNSSKITITCIWAFARKSPVESGILKELWMHHWPDLYLGH